MKIIRATPALKTLSDQIPIDVFVDASDVQTNEEDTPQETAALLKDSMLRKGRDCAVMFEIGGHTLYFIGTASEVAERLENFL